MTLFVRFKHDSLEIIQLKPKISWANTGKELPNVIPQNSFYNVSKLAEADVECRAYNVYNYNVECRPTN